MGQPLIGAPYLFFYHPQISNILTTFLCFLFIYLFFIFTPLFKRERGTGSPGPCRWEHVRDFARHTRSLEPQTKKKQRVSEDVCVWLCASFRPEPSRG